MNDTRKDWSDDELAYAWIRRFSSSRKKILSSDTADSELANQRRIAEETTWAFNALEGLVAANPADAWRLILRILQLAADDEDALDNLAAGPLESLLGRHGRKVISWVEAEAKQNPKFKDLLSGVWQNMVPELIWQRVQRAAE